MVTLFYRRDFLFLFTQNILHSQTEDIKRIDVNSQNKYAKHFYLSHGFEIESEEDLDGFGKPYPITHLVKK